MFFFLCLKALIFFTASHQPGSDAVLLLLDCVDAVLDTIALSTDPSSVSTADLTKHHDAIKTAAEQHLYSLDIALETYQLISKRLECLNKAFEGFKVDKASDLLGEMQVSAEVSSFAPLPLITFFLLI